MGLLCSQARALVVGLTLMATACAEEDTEGPSPLSGVIVYATEEFGQPELAVVHPDGSGRRRLTTDQLGYVAPAVSPDGRRIAFGSVRGGVSGIYLMNADASGVTLLVAREFAYSPAWSPDGSQIAFRSTNPGPFGTAGRIFVINVDGTGLRQLSPDVPDPSVFYYFDDGPTWSPDGHKVAFSRMGTLHVIAADGTGLTPLPNPEGAGYPDWSPDGTRLAYGAQTGGRGVYLRNADGSNPFALTLNPGQEDFPRWSPDSQRLVFCRVTGGKFQLFIIDADGGGEFKLSVASTAHECTPSWSPLP